MKKYLVVSGVLLLLTAALVAGCSEDTTDTTGPTTTSIGLDTTSLVGETTVPSAESGTFVDLTPQEAFALTQGTPDLVIIDVSTDYDEGHLPGAVNYPFSDGTLEETIPTLDKAVPYLVYCHAETNSIEAAQLLVDAGFMQVYRLAGDYAAWVAGGFPSEMIPM